MIDEAEYKRRLVAEVKSLRGWARRCEDKYAVGVLDLILKFPGYPTLWAEGKIVRGYKFYPSSRQWIEGERMQDAGMNVALIGWKSSEMFISPWTTVADARDCFSGPACAATVQAWLATRVLKTETAPV